MNTDPGAAEWNDLTEVLRPGAGPDRHLSDFAAYLDASRQVPEFRPDMQYETQDGIAEVLDAIRSRAPLVFVSGRAGTGKSRLIDYLRKMPCGRRQVVVAPTGIAALSLKASTIHAFFRLPIGVIDAAQLALDEQQLGRAAREMTRLVIDEISMVRADMLDAIDARLRVIRDDDRPFGGVQVVVVGDFLQLPPVVRDEDRSLLERLGYQTPFAFSARVMQQVPVRVATLSKVWRQTDPEMVSALGRIREGRDVAAAIAWLNGKCAREHREGAVPLLLTTTRSAADAYNAKGFASLSGASRPAGAAVFRAVSGGAFDNDQAVLPAPRMLEVMPGLRVMSVKNDPAGCFVNGSLGVVEDACDGGGSLEDAWVSVRFDGRDAPQRVTPADWSKTRQDWSEETETIVETTTGFYQQIPLIVGYAITIHKSQGLTLDDARIDLCRGAFAPGQLYVALSRVRTVEGLSFVRPIAPQDVRVDEMLLRFLEWARAADNLELAQR